MTSHEPPHRLYSEIEEYTGQHRAPEPRSEQWGPAWARPGGYSEQDRPYPVRSYFEAARPVRTDPPPYGTPPHVPPGPHNLAAQQVPPIQQRPLAQPAPWQPGPAQPGPAQPFPGYGQYLPAGHVYESVHYESVHYYHSVRYGPAPGGPPPPPGSPPPGSQVSGGGFPAQVPGMPVPGGHLPTAPQPAQPVPWGPPAAPLQAAPESHPPRAEPPAPYVAIGQAPVRSATAERVVRPVTRVPGPSAGTEVVPHGGADRGPVLPAPTPMPVAAPVHLPIQQTRRSGPPPEWSPSSSTGRILIVGSGPAGLSAAEEARRLGFAGRITIMGDEPTGPYDRPACSKGLLNGHQTPRDTLLAVPTGLELDWQLGRKAVHLDAAGRRVTAHTGEMYDYDGLVIATGARPALPKGWPAGQPGLHVLHTLHDSWSLRRDLREARRVAIVGGGLTGCEVACAVRGMAREAVIIDPRNCLMHRAIGETAGLLVTEEHSAAGIELRLGRRVTSVRRGRDWELLLDDGTFVHADVVVVANGGRPDVGWLAGNGMDTSNGVLCDASLRVHGVAGVVAAGVIARWPNLWSGGPPDRVGQWIAALEHGRGAMRALLAGRRSIPAMTLIPRFWSHQNDLRIQVCGNPDPDADLHMVGRGSRRPAARSGVLASYYKGGHLVGLVAINSAPAFTAAARGMLAAEAAAEWHPAGPPDRTLSGAVAVAEMAG
jgi:NADPH-dependent 2,4-dienoyl-CoA reductase/sulfur reductase-like enzyme